MVKIFDLHNDFLLKVKSDNMKERFVERNEQYIEKIIGAVWTSELASDEAVEKIKRGRDFANRHGNLFFAIEDLHFLSKENLEEFAVSIRPKYAGLTWNNTNCLAGGANESGRLTQFGKQTIKVFEKSNIQIDTAHLNEESFVDVAKVSSRPILCSHTACFGLHQHSRNLKDYQIKMIVDSNGLLGICLVSDFLSGEVHSSVSNLAQHIDYVACKFGIENLALGTDFFGTKHLPKQLNNYKNITILLSEKLKSFGYTERSINKIFYENAMRFFSTEK